MAFGFVADMSFVHFFSYMLLVQLFLTNVYVFRSDVCIFMEDIYAKTDSSSMWM
jgi:hypothetical protein